MIKAFFGSVVGRIVGIGLIALITGAITYHFFTLGVQTRKAEQATAERDTLGVWIISLCDSVGTPPQKTAVLYRSGCKETVRRLSFFYTTATSETTRKLVEAEQLRVKNLEADNAARIKNEQSLKNQLRRLREISANVKDDNVGPEYWAAVNRVGGLHPPGQAGPAAAGSSDSGGHVDPTSPTPGTP